MSFRDYKPLTQKIFVDAAQTIEAEIRAINARDISTLFARYETDLEFVFRGLLNAEGRFDTERAVRDLPEVLASAISVAPSLIVDLIVIASDEEDAREQIHSMSVSEMMNVVGEIIGLTMRAEGDLGKIMAAVTAALRARGESLPPTA